MERIEESAEKSEELIGKAVGGMGGTKAAIDGDIIRMNLML